VATTENPSDEPCRKCERLATALTLYAADSYAAASKMYRMQPSELPLAAARWFFLSNIVLAAWMYGGTRDWAREAVTWLLLANTGLFAAGLITRLRLPRIPPTAGLAVGFLLLQGSFMTWNAQRRFVEGARVFVDKIQPVPGMPGFMDTQMVLPSLLLAIGLLGAFCIACDLARNPVWSSRLWVTLAGTGLSLVILGLAQRLTEAPAIFWDVNRNIGETFFSVFRYHANAGAFINLVLPLTSALAVKSWLPGGGEGKRVLWTLAALLTAAAGFVNVSRAANVVCVLLLIGIGLVMGWIKFQTAGKRGIVTGSALALAMTAVALALAFSFGVEKTLLRWDIGLWKNTPQEDGRYQAYEVVVTSALPAAGAWGFGPGTFEAMFDIHRRKSGSMIAGRWDKAHSDVLQTPMEWGLVGATAWFVLIAGGMIRAARNAANRDCGEARILAAGCAFSLAGVALHSMVDFPLQIASLALITVIIAGLGWGAQTKNTGKLRKNKLAERRRRTNMLDADQGTTGDPK